MNRIKWNVFSPTLKPAAGLLCRWIVQDLFEGLVKFTSVADKCGLPSGEWTEQMIRAWREEKAVAP
jgi:hypothetical protein